MKKKVVVAVLALALAVGVTACTNQAGNGAESAVGTEESGATPGESLGEHAGESGQNTVGEQSGIVQPGENGTAGQQELFGFKYLLGSGFEQSSVDVLDGNGVTVTAFDWAAFKEKCKAKGYDLDEATLDLIEGDTIYMHQYEDTGDRYASVVYAVKTDTFDIKKLFVASDGFYEESMDFYDGKLYLDCSKYEDGNSFFKEVVFEKDPNDLQFREVKAENPALQAALDSCSQIMHYSANTSTAYQNCSLARAFAENGCVLGRKEDCLVKITEDGSMTLIPGFSEESFYARAYNAEYAVYEKYDENWDSELCYVNMSTGETKKVERLMTSPTSIEFLSLADGRLYYYEQEEMGFVQKRNHVCVLDLASGAAQVLYSEDSIPGASSIMPGTQRFQVHDGAIYYQGVDGTNLAWMRVEVKDSGVEKKVLSVVETFDLFRYGKVLCDTYVEKCPFCGIDLELYYGEAFQLDSQYSAHADAINEVLSQKLKQTIASYQTASSDYTPSEEDCEEHKEYPNMYCQTVEDYVTNVEFLGDKYMAVNMDGYWYGGGAHGQPYMNQYLFDLTTGEQKEFRDFYQGTEEDFKKLVAQKTQEDFLSYDDDMSPYFASDEEAVYNEAYETASLEYTQIVFQEDGVYIVFQPYEMGPFASGFIEIRVTYEELLGRPQL